MACLHSLQTGAIRASLRQVGWTVTTPSTGSSWAAMPGNPAAGAEFDEIPYFEARPLEISLHSRRGHGDSRAQSTGTHFGSLVRLPPDDDVF
jgi:hypothetical protein